MVLLFGHICRLRGGLDLIIHGLGPPGHHPPRVNVCAETESGHGDDLAVRSRRMPDLAASACTSAEGRISVWLPMRRSLRCPLISDVT
jgi:hypothetical protein